jgi:predicted RNase H-like nuclease (RuvC/YqgF family)
LNEDQSALAKKLKAKECEVQKLRSIVKELEKQFHKANVQYEQRVEEIKSLHLKVQDLSNEKRLLTLDLNTRDDSRQHIFRLQRNLTEEQLKRKALEEELAQPRNIHRWRHLQV